MSSPLVWSPMFYESHLEIIENKFWSNMLKERLDYLCILSMANIKCYKIIKKQHWWLSSVSTRLLGWLSQDSVTCFHLGWPQERFGRETWRAGEKRQPRGSSHVVLLSCWLTSLVWGSSRACSRSTSPRMLLQLLQLLSQVRVLSLVRQSTSFCRTPTSSGWR